MVTVHAVRYEVSPVTGSTALGADQISSSAACYRRVEMCEAR